MVNIFFCYVAGTFCFGTSVNNADRFFHFLNRHVVKHDNIRTSFYCFFYHVKIFNFNFNLTYKWSIFLCHLYSLRYAACCTDMAHADVYALLKKYRPKGIVHCYSGSADDALWLAEQGLYIGFGGACTFKGAKRAAKAIAALPLERIVLETDCPYMAPEPVRGTRCDSSLIRYVGEYIASVKGEEPEQVFRQTVENACQVYNLSV